MDSNKNKAIGVFGQLPTWAKGVIAIALTGAALYGGYKIYLWVKKKHELEGSNKENKDTSRELSELNRNPKTAQTLSKSDADAIANQIFAAMDGYGTDTRKIVKQLMYIKNKADWMNLRCSRESMCA